MMQFTEIGRHPSLCEFRLPRIPRSARLPRAALLIAVLAMPIDSPVAAILADESSVAVRIEGESTLEVPVGMSGTLRQVVLPGSELAARVVDPRTTPIVLRIDQVFPHGDGFRYDITWFGMEPGQYDLADYLTRADGTSTETLPPISVTVTTTLAADRILPNPPESPAPTAVGGYRNLLILGGVVWVVGFFVILLSGRRQPSSGDDAGSESPLTRLQRIELLLNRAITTSQFDAADKARLEGLIVGFWAERKGLQQHDPQQMLTKLRNDSDAAPLLQQLERWLYDRPQATDVDIVQLLTPLRQLITTAGGNGSSPAAVPDPVAQREVNR